MKNSVILKSFSSGISVIMDDSIPFEVKRTVPNAQTRAALAEYEAMKKNPSHL